MTSAVHQEIAHQSRIGVSSSQILTGLRLDTDEETPLFKRTDIYNAKARIRRHALGPYTSVQALMQELLRDDWFFKHEQDEYNRIT